MAKQYWVESQEYAPWPATLAKLLLFIAAAMLIVLCAGCHSAPSIGPEVHVELDQTITVPDCGRIDQRHEAIAAEVLPADPQMPTNPAPTSSPPVEQPVAAISSPATPEPTEPPANVSGESTAPPAAAVEIAQSGPVAPLEWNFDQPAASSAEPGKPAKSHAKGGVITATCLLLAAFVCIYFHFHHAKKGSPPSGNSPTPPPAGAKAAPLPTAPAAGPGAAPVSNQLAATG